jgi:hypothetical protein
MIYGPLSKYPDSAEAAVAPGVVIFAEGLALVRAVGAQSAGVLPSTGTAADVFAGFSLAGTSAAPFAEGYMNKVETFVVPATGGVSLQFAPVAGQVFVFDTTAGAAVALGTGLALTGQNLAGTGLVAGDEVTVTYKYPLSVVQARALFGDPQPGGYSGAYIGQIGLIKRGLIYTSEFDSSKNWAAATGIKLAAGGQLTDQSGTGNALAMAAIVALPGSDVPFLGIEFAAP